MFVHFTQGAAFLVPRSALLQQVQHRSCFLTTLLPVPSHHNQNCVHTMAALILIRYHGWIKTAVITSRQAHSWNLRTFTISKGVSPGAQISSVWALTIKAIELFSAHPQLTTDLWRENTLRDVLLRKGHSPIYDSPCFRGRLLLQTKFTIFTLLSRLPGCIGWFRFLKVGLSLVLTGRRQHLR